MTLLKGLFEIYVQRWEFFLELLIEHVWLTSVSVLFIAVIGMTIGIAIAKNRMMAGIVLSAINFLYTIPSIALFGFLVALTGIGNRSAIIALVTYGVLPVIRNTYVGITEVEDQIIESAVGMGTTQRQLLLRVQLPLAMPVIIAGFRTMVIMTIALAGIASFIGAGGLGVAIWRGITTNYPEMTIAGSLLVALFAIAADLVLAGIEKTLYQRVLGREEKGGQQHGYA